MGAQIPQAVATSSYHYTLISHGLPQENQGKVRNAYRYSRPLLGLEATDRISIFDFVLNALVPRKGEVLTAMTVFWLTEILSGPHHLVAYGGALRNYRRLPRYLRENRDFLARFMLIKRCKMLPIEAIMRGYLTGSGWSKYQEVQQVCGIRLPEGLHDGSRLEPPLFTPTTKATVGHDVHIDREVVRKQRGGWVEWASLGAYSTAHEYARTRGIIIADTKFEFGARGILADEALTPDSSRFWDAEEWEAAQLLPKPTSPTSKDKEIGRKYGKGVNTPHGVGIHKLKPEIPAHVEFVSNLPIPIEVTNGLSLAYLDIFFRLTGMTLDRFQSEIMKI